VKKDKYENNFLTTFFEKEIFLLLRIKRGYKKVSKPHSKKGD
jgi:hypothetical protein